MSVDATMTSEELDSVETEIAERLGLLRRDVNHQHIRSLIRRLVHTARASSEDRDVKAGMVRRMNVMFAALKPFADMEDYVARDGGQHFRPPWTALHDLCVPTLTREHLQAAKHAISEAAYDDAARIASSAQPEEAGIEVKVFNHVAVPMTPENEAKYAASRTKRSGRQDGSSG